MADQDTPTTPTAGGDSGTDTPTESGGAPQTEERTFTQEDVDRIIGDRVRRAGKGAVSELLTGLEIKDAAELKRIIEGHRQAAEAEKTEMEKAQARITELEAQAVEAQAQAQARLIQAEVAVSAATLGFRNPADAYALADLAEVVVEDGKVAGIKAALEAVLKNRPYLKAEPTNAPDIDATRAGSTTPGTAPGVTDEDVIEFAARFGIDPQYVDKKALQGVRS